MKKSITRIMAALALLVTLAIPMGMRAAEGDVHDMGITQSTLLNNNAAIPSINIAAQSYSVNKVTINWRYNKDIENPVTIEVLVGENSWGTQTITGNTTSDAVFEGESTIGAIVINFTNNTGSGTGHGTFYVNSVKLTEGESSGPAPTNYTVTFDAGDGTFVGNTDFPNASNIVAAGTYTLPSATPATGYTFDGWAMGETTYQAGASYTVSGDADFVASYTENTTPTPGGTTATLNIEAYAEANSWVNATQYTTATVAPVTFTANGGGNTGKYYTSGQNWRFYQGESASITITVPDGYTLVSVTPTYSVSNGGVLKNENTTIASGTTVSVSGTSVTYTVGNSGSATNGQVRFTNIDVVYVSNGGVIPPSITANNVEITYDTDADEIEYEINNAVDGGVLTASTESEWLTLGEVGATVPFACSVNEAGTERTATVTLTYTYNRATVTKDVTVTQAGNPNVTMTIAEVREQGTGNVVTIGTVTSFSENNNNTTAYIQDASAAIVVYGNFTTSVGDEIRVSGTLSTYHGLLEITNPEVTVISQGNTVNPEVMTVAEAVASTNQGWYIRIEDATVTEIEDQNTTIAQGENTIVVRGISGVEYVVNDVLSLNGNIGCYDGNQIANPQNVEVQAAPAVPSITFNPDVVNVDAEEHDGTLDLTYENLTITDMTDFGIQFCDANGDELSEEPDWIEVMVASQNPEIGEGYVVSYYMVENEGPDARTAYFKVYAMDDEGELVYSNLVTVNQEGVEVPPTGDEYALYTGELVEGDYLIVYGGGAMNTTVTSDRLQYEDVTVNNDVIVTDNAAIVWHIARSGEYWTIYNADAVAFAASTGVKNKAQMLADGTDDKALWTVSGTETYEFVNKFNTANSVNANLRKNGTYGFACYATSTGGALSLYKKVETLPANSIVIEGYGESEGGYYLIASPFTVSPEDVQGMTEGEYDLYSFDEAEENEWRNYKAGAFTNLEPGKGYLYAHSTTVTLTFDGEAYNGDPIVLKKTTGGDFPGWNLVGNPYTETAYIARDFYVMNPETGGEIITGEGNEIAPMQGFFVIAANDGEELEISTTAPAEQGGKIVMNVSNGRSSVIDRAMVRFGEGRTLPKFMLNDENTKIYITEGNEEFAVVRSIDENATPVSFHAAENGTYTLSINAENVEMEYLHLLDNMTGADVDLLATPSYTFEARTTDYANRFKLVYATTTDVNENNVEPFAFFNGSEWVINNEGEATLQVIDINGRMLSNETVNDNANVNINATSGIYMLRLVNGESVKTQKVVVK